MIATLSTMTTARRALMGAALGAEVLQAGITTVRDLGNAGMNGDADLRDAFAANWFTGPRMVVATRSLAPPGGQFGLVTPAAMALVDQEYVVVSGAAQATQAVRNAVYAGADVIKLILNTGQRKLSLDEVRAAVDEANRLGKKVAAHAIGDDVIRIAVDAGVSSIEHAYSIPDDALRGIASKGIFLVPTDWTEEILGLMYVPDFLPADIKAQRMRSYHDREASRTERLRKALAAGVRVAFGSDIYYDLPGLSRGEASLRILEGYAKAGLSPLQVLQTATLNAAELLGAADRLGTLDVGRWADVVVVDGDPTVDVSSIRRVKAVIKAGRVMRRDSTF